MLMKVQSKIVNPLLKKYIPNLKYQTIHSAGIDLIACIDSPITLKAGQTQLIGSGLAVFIDNPGFAGYIIPRSGLGHKHGIVLGNLVGLIDADYQGEIKISCWNRSETDFIIEPGLRLAQLVVAPVQQVSFNWVDSFEESARGSAGFGSTGQKTSVTAD